MDNLFFEHPILNSPYEYPSRHWEAEFCSVAERHPKVLAYVKNHNLEFEVPYQYGSTKRTYIPDDGHVLGTRRQ